MVFLSAADDSRFIHRRAVVDGVIGHATFSLDMTYRYVLSRTWGDDDDGRTAFWIMLNPSTATESELDPTIRRCLGYTIRWGMTKMIVCNLFALRATNPDDMKRHRDPIGPDNDAVILSGLEMGWALFGRDAVTPIAAWGTHGSHMGRAADLTTKITAAGFPLYCLGTNADGSPKHPLHMLKGLNPMPYRPAMMGRRM